MLIVEVCIGIVIYEGGGGGLLSWAGGGGGVLFNNPGGGGGVLFNNPGGGGGGGLVY